MVSSASISGRNSTLAFSCCSINGSRRFSVVWNLWKQSVQRSSCCFPMQQSQRSQAKQPRCFEQSAKDCASHVDVEDVKAQYGMETQTFRPRFT